MNTLLEIQIKEGRSFRPLVRKKQQWLLHRPEEEVRQRVVPRLVNEYGYELQQMSQELAVVKGQRGTGRPLRKAAGLIDGPPLSPAVGPRIPTRHSPPKIKFTTSSRTAIPRAKRIWTAQVK